jgi:hypothetical protein
MNMFINGERVELDATNSNEKADAAFFFCIEP